MVNIKIPNNLKERFASLELTDNEIEEKYMLYFADGWCYQIGYNDFCYCLPVRNKKEAIDFLKGAEKINEQ